MLFPLGSELRTSDFTTLWTTIWANSSIFWTSQICPRIKRAWLYKDLKVYDFENEFVDFQETNLYIGIEGLCWFQIFSQYKNQKTMNT